MRRRITPKPHHLCIRRWRCFADGLAVCWVRATSLALSAVQTSDFCFQRLARREPPVLLTLHLDGLKDRRARVRRLAAASPSVLPTVTALTERPSACSCLMMSSRPTQWLPMITRSAIWRPRSPPFMASRCACVPSRWTRHHAASPRCTRLQTRRQALMS